MTEKLELDIPVLLPEVPDAADACVGRLVSTLSAKPGVERAHVLPADGDTPAKLCIHFDPAALPLPRVREMVSAAGAEISKAAAARVVDATVSAITKAVAAGDVVTLIGFGTFKPLQRAAREGKNPQTGAKLKIAATTVPKFTAGATFKAAVAAAKTSKKKK